MNDIKQLDFKGPQACLPEVLFDLVMFEELGETFLTDNEAGDHIEPYFNGRRAVDVTPEVIIGYVIHRLEEGASSMVIDGELKALRRVFTLAMMACPPRATEVPHIPFFAELEPLLKVQLLGFSRPGQK